MKFFLQITVFVLVLRYLGYFIELLFSKRYI